LETRGYNHTKSAFADYSAASLRIARTRVAETAAAKTAAECGAVEAQSAKADFVPFQRRVSNPATIPG
jgi:hypothetical protein